MSSGLQQPKPTDTEADPFSHLLTSDPKVGHGAAKPKATRELHHSDACGTSGCPNKRVSRGNRAATVSCVLLTGCRRFCLIAGYCGRCLNALRNQHSKPSRPTTHAIITPTKAPTSNGDAFAFVGSHLSPAHQQAQPKPGGVPMAQRQASPAAEPSGFDFMSSEPQHQQQSGTESAFGFI